MIQVTEAAARKVKELLVAEKRDGYGLRVAVQGGGCSGFQYGLSFENTRGANDEVMEVEGRSRTISLPVELPRSWFY